MKEEEELRILRELSESKGWALLKSKMEQEILAAAGQMADMRPMPEDEIHFRRGAMWAAKKLLKLPEAMTTILENQLILQQDSATAESLSQTRSLRPAPDKEKK